jgi:hypothetical protein
VSLETPISTVLLTHGVRKIIETSPLKHAVASSHMHGSRNPASDACVCQYLIAQPVPEYTRLDINFEDDLSHSLAEDWSEPLERTLNAEYVQDQVDLQSLLSSTNNRPWPIQQQYALTILLAHSFSYLYGLSPIKGRWRRENIVFFRDGESIPLRLFFDASSRSGSVRVSDGMTLLHRFPDILTFGVILLEIHLGRRLEIHLRNHPEIDLGSRLRRHLNAGGEFTSDNDLFIAAGKLFDKEKYKIAHRVCRNAIEACLKAGTFVDFRDDIHELRRSLSQIVVDPLRSELLERHLELDFEELDKQANEYDLARSDDQQRSTSNRLRSHHQGKKPQDRPSVKWEDQQPKLRVELSPEPFQGRVKPPDSVESRHSSSKSSDSDDDHAFMLSDATPIGDTG